MDGKLRSASGIASQTDALAKLEAEVSRRAGCNRAAFLQNTSCVLPYGPAIKRLFKFAPGEFVSVVFFGCRKKSASPVSATTHSIITPNWEKISHMRSK